MASKINVGDRVRINEKYNEIIGNRAVRGQFKKNAVGVEFTVTGTHHDKRIGGFVSGDPNGWGVMDEYVDVIEGNEAERIAKIQKTSSAIREMGQAIDRLRQRADISPRAHASLIGMLDDITDAIQEERA